MANNGRKRVIIEEVEPEIDSGQYPIKRVVGEKVVVQADIFGDGHEEIAAVLLYRKSDEEKWHEVPMKALLNDRWEAKLAVGSVGIYYYTIKGWIDRFQTWQKDLQRKFKAGQDVKVELLVGAEFIEKAAERASPGNAKKLKSVALELRNEQDEQIAVTLAVSDRVTALMKIYPDQRLANIYEKQLAVVVDRKKALFSTWYELFPRSCGSVPGRHGTFKDCERLLPEISKLGFDVIYFPPIHPIGETNRKGKDSLTLAGPDDPGSPWAIGSEAGGHKSIHPQLGTLEDFEKLVKKGKDYGIEIALDLAFQCSPDHPYVKEHPEWFKWRPNGTVQHAENPPKIYEDILPINFETENWQELWEELKSVVLFWIDKGVQIFRVDNPHTKPFAFWEWLIKDIKKDYPGVIFLSEAFTRPKVMFRLAKLGFTQSYTYFTWRNTKRELINYFTELTQREVREFFRPNLWPNTPDILPEHLQYGGKPAFIVRLVLAATLSSNYGIYGPAFENYVHEAEPGKEEYLNSEKYQIKQWDRNKPGNLKELIARVNQIRRENAALQTTWNLSFYQVDNEYLLCYGKACEDFSNILIIAVNLDPFHTQSGSIRIPIEDFGISQEEPYLVHELLNDTKYIWQGESNYVELDPQKSPANIFRVHRRLRREHDFDYYL